MFSIDIKGLVEAVITIIEADRTARRERATQQKMIGDYYVITPIDENTQYDFDEYEIIHQPENLEA